MMKHFSLFIILFSFLFAACSEEEITSQEQGTIQKSFSLSIEEPDYAPQSRATGGVSRYLMEMYEGSLEGTLVKKESSTNGQFDVEVKKGVDYICLFWADDNTSYNANNLKAVTQTSETALGTAAYCARVTVNSKTFNGAISLKRAVAELSFIDKNGLTETTNMLKIIYPYASSALNVGDGTVTRTAGETIRTIAGIVPPAQATDAFATDFILAPTEAGQLAGLKFQLNAEEEKTIASLAVQANFRTKITGEYQALITNVMRFTINTTKNTDAIDDKTFIVPFPAGTITGYGFTIEWGDEQTTVFADGATLSEADLTHTYATEGEYTITITSSQEDPAQVQMPKLAFGQNYAYTNNNPAKLISLDSPLLNMGADLSSCFNGCSNLTSIPEKLFEKNTAATNFNGCFNVCMGLTEIPAGLFTANTLATNFSSCFYNCDGLTAVPELLFEKNTEATNFYGCFQNCNGLTSIPELLFEKNAEAKDFMVCFRSCTNLTEIPAGLFTANTAATNFSYCFANCTKLTEIPVNLFAANTAATNFSSCFLRCTGLTSIPANLFTANTLATNFSNCFEGCTKLKLNADIFCDEATEKTTRFTGKTMNFSYCFENCGSDGSVTNGGTAPALWDYTMETSSSKEYCFNGVTKVTNVLAIPEEWK